MNGKGDVSTSDHIVIAVDGPAASGKGTLARRLASFYGLGYLDTGSIYRGVGWLMLSQNLDPRHDEDAARLAKTFTLDAIAEADIRTPDVGRAASIIAAKPAVREALLSYQRDYASTPPGAILDGRDIGTVVCPDALVKLFIDASLEARAERRWRELSARDASITLQAVLEDIRRRDARDSGREAAPMRAAKDAVLLDTTQMDIDTVFAAACRVINRALEEKRA